MHSDAVQHLIDQLGRLPGVGPKSAQRIAYHLLKVPRDDALALASAVVDAKDRVRFCTTCHNLADAERIDADGVTEVILCTNPNLEGDTTAMYLARLLTPLEVQVTRIASGLPVGGDLEYADELTLGRAIEGRRPVEP